VSAGTVTIARNDTTNILAGDASFDVAFASQSIGDYASWTLDSIDLIDENKTFEISFAKQDGTGFVEGDLEVYFYDGSSETLVQLTTGTDVPAGTAIFKGSVVVGTGLTGTPELRFKAADNAHDFALVLDEIKAGPQIVNSPSIVVTDWTAFTMTIDAVTTAPTKGTVTTDKARWRRVGDSMEITYSYAQTTAGSSGSGDYLFQVPSGYTIDTTKLETDNTYTLGVVGNGHIGLIASDFQGVTVQAYDSTSLRLVYDGYVAGVSAAGSGSYSIGGANREYSFTAKVPIVGWSSNIVTADNAQVEYLYNTQASINTADTTSFATGAVGALVLGHTATTALRVRASRDLSNATIFLQAQENGTGPWTNVGEGPYAENYYQSSGGSSFYYGMAINVFSSTDLDIDFKQTGSGILTGNTWAQEATATTRWRVKVIYNPAFVEAPQNSQVVNVYDSKSPGGASGAFNSGAWQTRDLTELDDLLNVGWCSLSSNQFTLQAGTYELEWNAPAYYVDQHQSRLYNITDSTVSQTAGGGYLNNSAGTGDTCSLGFAMVLIASSKTFEIQHKCQTSRAGDGFGSSKNSALTVTEEIYAQVKIRKIG
jgi:hypothetical protein